MAALLGEDPFAGFDQGRHLVSRTPRVWVFDGFLSPCYLDYVDGAFAAKVETRSEDELRTEKDPHLFQRMVRFKADDPYAREVAHVMARLANSKPMETFGEYLVSDMWSDKESHAQRLHMDHVHMLFEKRKWIDRNRNWYSANGMRVIPTLSFVVNYSDSSGVHFPSANRGQGMSIPAKRGRIVMFENYRQKPWIEPAAKHQGIYSTAPKRLAVFGIIANERPRPGKMLEPCILYNPIGPGGRDAMDFRTFYAAIRRLKFADPVAERKLWVNKIHGVEKLYWLAQNFERCNPGEHSTNWQLANWIVRLAMPLENEARERPAKYSVGQRVKTTRMHKAWGMYWYPGTVERVNANGTYRIAYDESRYGWSQEGAEHGRWENVAESEIGVMETPAAGRARRARRHAARLLPRGCREPWDMGHGDYSLRLRVWWLEHKWDSYEKVLSQLKVRSRSAEWKHEDVWQFSYQESEIMLMLARQFEKLESGGYLSLGFACFIVHIIKYPQPQCEPVQHSHI